MKQKNQFTQQALKKRLPYRFLNELKALPYVDRILLFGSRARGDYMETSDIDIAITCPHASPQEWLKIIDIVEEADTLLKIDCIRWDELPCESPTKKNILVEGVILGVMKK